MELRSQTRGVALVLTVIGRIDHSRANAFEAALAPHLQFCTASGKPLVLDFSGVDFISSVGLRVLMLAAKQVKQQQAGRGGADPDCPGGFSGQPLQPGPQGVCQRRSGATGADSMNLDSSSIDRLFSSVISYDD